MLACQMGRCCVNAVALHARRVQRAAADGDLPPRPPNAGYQLPLSSALRNHRDNFQACGHFVCNWLLPEAVQDAMARGVQQPRTCAELHAAGGQCGHKALKVRNYDEMYAEARQQHLLLDSAPRTVTRVRRSCGTAADGRRLIAPPAPVPGMPGLQVLAAAAAHCAAPGQAGHAEPHAGMQVPPADAAPPEPSSPIPVPSPCGGGGLHHAAAPPSPRSADSPPSEQLQQCLMPQQAPPLAGITATSPVQRNTAAPPPPSTQSHALVADRSGPVQTAAAPPSASNPGVGAGAPSPVVSLPPQRPRRVVPQLVGPLPASSAGPVGTPAAAAGRSADPSVVPLSGAGSVCAPPPGAGPPADARGEGGARRRLLMRTPLAAASTARPAAGAPGACCGAPVAAVSHTFAAHPIPAVSARRGGGARSADSGAPSAGASAAACRVVRKRIPIGQVRAVGVGRAGCACWARVRVCACVYVHVRWCVQARAVCELVHVSVWVSEGVCVCVCAPCATCASCDAGGVLSNPAIAGAGRQ